MYSKLNIYMPLSSPPCMAESTFINFLPSLLLSVESITEQMDVCTVHYYNYSYYLLVTK